ncbi:MAG: hypothetical protein LBQ36_05855, partial [Synergistaceae bacterium]|nr:hypothetical protein [Synergistaceae bacterium]
MNISASSSNVIPPSLQENVMELYKLEMRGERNKSLEEHIRSAEKNTNRLAAAGDVYLNVSPSGSYRFIGDSVAISSEAYKAILNARWEEIYN